MRTGIAASVFGMALLLFAGRVAAQDEKKVDLQVGDPAPVFKATDHLGKEWKSADLVGKKFVVVYFFPAAFTSGCRTQAQKFRDNMNALTEKGVIVIGVSGDTVAAQELFKKVEMLNFTLLADEDGSVAKQFGVPLGKGGEVKTKDANGQPVVLKRTVTAARWTFIIGLDGKLLYKNTKVDPATDSKQVTEFIEKLQKK